MSDVLVFDYKQPLQHLTAWFLSDRGVANIRVTTDEDLKDVASKQHPKVVVVNTTASLVEVADIINRAHAYDGNPFAIALYPQADSEADQTHADLAVHDVGDPDGLVHLVRRALKGELPRNTDEPESERRGL